MVQTLETGDLHIATDDDKLLIVERKTANDFVSSIKDGRLFNQVARAKQLTPYVYVVIVGSILPAKHGKTFVNGNLTGWDYAAIQGVMLSIQELGAAIVFCADDNDLLLCIARLANRSRDIVPIMPVRESIIFGGPFNNKTQNGVVLTSLQKTGASILTSLRGIGPHKAMQLMEIFQNAGTALQFLTDLSDSNDLKFAGIADGTKQNIVDDFGGSFIFQPKLNFEPIGENENGN